MNNVDIKKLLLSVLVAQGILTPEDAEAMPKLGTLPLKEQMIRLYHYTKGDPSTIAKEGLKLSHAKGSTYGEPNLIWASNKPPDPDIKNIVEFSVPANDPSMVLESPRSMGMDLSRWGEGTRHVGFTRDIKPSEFLQVHEPWQSKMEYIEDDPRLLREVIEGKHDDLVNNIGNRFPDEAKAILEIKKKYSAGHGIPLKDTITKMGVAAPVGAVLAEKLAERRKREEAEALADAINPIEYMIPGRFGGGVVNALIDTILRQAGQ